MNNREKYRMSPLLEVTEDTPPDMLAGSMDLRLVIPDGKRVRMSVDRRTPMMDLLVQVTTAYKISPAGYVLQPYGETGLLPYKPSTPIGALDTWIVHIVPKNQSLQNPSNKINLKQIIPPFEQTLRFQVNLPRNQLYVTRVSGRCSMRDILHQACSEKNLDPSKYTLRHPKQLDKPLCDELSIAEYGHNQVTMLSIKNLPTAVLTEDILQMNKYKAQSDSGSGSAASSVSPVVPVQPSKPVRKRRPAPKPPVQQRKEQSQKQQSETIICHSRTSSDSSGYHEASVLSESPDSNNSSLPDSLPRRSKLPAAETNSSRETNKLSRSLSNLHQASTSAPAKSNLKPAQSVSCLAPSMLTIVNFIII
ncbi:cordon-bleu protein-like 1 [Halyomorpha halys]|uniref:cordon-bleu protein-like 1 n=1 Tax=Halyomorpha halys TaxID=286706 RepID=UPI0034D2F263